MFCLRSLSAQKRMINMEVVMAEEGRDAMGLLSLMTGLSECCNGPGMPRPMIYGTSSCRRGIEAAWRG